MNHLILFTFTFLLFFCLSCSDKNNEMEEEEETIELDCSAADSKSLNLITGVRFFDESGSPLGQVGNPNVTPIDQLYVYPNPNNGVIAISKQNDIDYELFLFPCTKDTTCSDIDFSEYVFDYSQDELYDIDSTSIMFETPNIQIQFNSSLPAGYYKMVFFNENEDVIVENIYYDPDKSITESVDYLTGEF